MRRDLGNTLEVTKIARKCFRKADLRTELEPKMLLVNWVSRWVTARGASALHAALIAGLAFGCSDLESGSDTLKLEGTPDPKWDCLGKEREPPAVPSPPPAIVAYAVPIFDVTHPPNRVPNLKVQACQAQDADCTQPLPDMAYATMDVPTMLNGSVIDLPVYFIFFPFNVNVSWYLRLTTPAPADPSKLPDYLPFEYYFQGPLYPTPGVFVGDFPAIQGLPIQLLSAADADSFAAGIQQTRDKSAGIIALRTIDCTGQLAAGVTLSLEPNFGIPFTFLNSLARLADPPRPTDETGIAGFANIPLPLPGTSSVNPNVTVEGIAPDGTRFGQVATRIRPGQMTGGELRPHPTVFGR